MNKKYYALVAHNCVAVFDCWKLADQKKKYAVKPQFKKFDTFYQAEAYALEQFTQYYPTGYPPICRLECNQIVFTKHQRPDNVMGAVSKSKVPRLTAKEIFDQLGVEIDTSFDEYAEADFDSGDLSDDGKYHIIIH